MEEERKINCERCGKAVSVWKIVVIEGPPSFYNGEYQPGEGEFICQDCEAENFYY